MFKKHLERMAALERPWQKILDGPVRRADPRVSFPHFPTPSFVGGTNAQLHMKCANKNASKKFQVTALIFHPCST